MIGYPGDDVCHGFFPLQIPQQHVIAVLVEGSAGCLGHFGKHEQHRLLGNNLVVFPVLNQGWPLYLARLRQRLIHQIGEPIHGINAGILDNLRITSKGAQHRHVVRGPDVSAFPC